ncbi:FUSC family protein [Xanthobacter agilis]|uniref:Multidrug resistance protein MdtO n=1 Tax=Xanthobacter agilis TaxID=47492 RepID=A0ABU0L844_XANAG|nr:FUSC family protein [Xanthobacter agilis]MDQ0503269.1 multidrug resistance protein MdtO [Xanthobacter agilis]
MAAAVESPWRGIARQAWQDLLPFPGRFAMTWRVALLCAIVAGVAMVYKVPEAAIGCYLVIFLARPSGAECVGQAIGLILLVSVVVLAMAPLIQATADYPLARIAVIALTSFAFVFLGAASQLGEIGSIIALVIGFVLTLVDQLPVGEIATRGLLYAWQMAVMPMVAMIAFNLVLGTSPHRLLREIVARRLRVAADVLEAPQARARLEGELAGGLADGDQQAMLARLFHTAPAAAVTWLSGAATASYRLLLAVAALPADLAADARIAFAGQCRAAARAVAAGARPMVADPEPAAGPTIGAAGMVRALLAGLAAPNGGTDAVAQKPPFLAPDAFSNPDYQRYALKTTAAAISCYIIYSLIDWQGIHTAMITCYVAALGTTGETVHKLALRIAGCLVGAMLGFASILFVIPHLDSVGGLMALVFAGVLVGAWVSSGNERISYAGVQVGLAFLLTILNGFAPSLDMDSGRDRIVGILLGNVVVYVIFTGIWPKSAVVDARARLARALVALSRLAAMAPAARLAATADAAQVEMEAEKAEGQLMLLPFEPPAQRPSAAVVARLAGLVEETRALLPALLFLPAPSAELSRRLADAAARVAPSGGCGDGPAVAAGDEDGGVAAGLTTRLHRIERLAAG